MPTRGFLTHVEEHGLKLRDFILGLGATGAGMLLYGALVESNRLVLERRRLRLPLWPASMDGYRIGLLADLHLRDRFTVELAQRACNALMEEKPDAIAIAGDLIGHWRPTSIDLLTKGLAPLDAFKGPIIAVPGNHDYWLGEAGWMEPVLSSLGIQLLRNEAVKAGGVAWVGIDSLNAARALPIAAAATRLGLKGSKKAPTIVLWHEPDAVGMLPDGYALMLSGHTHGGQFVFPGGWAPMSTKNGRIYRDGFFPDAPTPLYVSRGLATTGPPSRFLCPPEATILELCSQDNRDE